MRWPQVANLLAAMGSGLLAGYLLGLTIGFTLFDPNLDLWALLGATLAVIGALAGLLPVVRRYTTVLLAAVAGYYVGMLVGLVLVVRTVDAGLLEVLQDSGGRLLVIAGTVIGAVLGWRLRRSAVVKVILAGFVFCGFFAPLVLLPGLANRSEFGLAPLVLISGLLGGAVAYGLYRTKAQH